MHSQSVVLESFARLRLGRTRAARLSIGALALIVSALVVASAAPAAATTPHATGVAIVTREDATGDHDLVLRELGTGHEQPLVSDEGDDHSAVFSPDGTKIAFVRETGGQADIYVVDAAGTEPPLLVTDNDSDDLNPAWGPDSNTIVFDSDRPSTGERQIYKTSANNPGLVTRLTLGSQFENFEPSVSPDGFTVVHVRREHAVPLAEMQIWSTNVGTKASTPFTQVDGDGMENRNPEYSPDGTKIAFSTNRTTGTNSFDIWVMDANGDNEVAVTTAAEGEGSPRWWRHDGHSATPRLTYTTAQPDGATRTDWDIKVIDLDGSDEAALLGQTNDDQFLDLQPLAGCTIVWDGSAGTAWDDEDNWDLGRVPLASDAACVPNMQQPVSITYNTTAPAVGSLTTWENVTLEGGQMTATTVTIKPGGEFKMTGGTFSANAVDAAGGTLNITSGTATVNAVSASANGVLKLAGGTLNASTIAAAPGIPMTLTGGTLASGSLGASPTLTSGAFSWASSGTSFGSEPWTVGSAATLQLAAGGWYEIPASRSINNNGTIDLGKAYTVYGAGELRNLGSGTVVKNVALADAAHVTTLESAFDNDGTVAATRGTISVHTNDGSDVIANNDAGTWNTGGSGTVEFPTGRTNLGRADAFTGTGTFRLNGGRLDVAGRGLTLPSAQTLHLASGVLSGSGDLTGGTFAWGNATLGGTAQFTVANNTVLDLVSVGGWYEIPTGGSLTNNGTIRLNKAYTVYGAGALINNSAKTIVKDTTDAAHTTNFETTTFDNDGIVSVPSGTVHVHNNDGTDIDAKNDSGYFNTGDDGTVEFRAGRTNLGRADAFTGTGTFRLKGGHLNVGTHGLTLPSAQTLHLDSGVLSGSGDLTGGTFAWNNATLGDAAQFTVTNNAVLDLVSVGGWYQIPTGGSLTNNGTIKLNKAATIYGSGTLINNSGGTIVKNVPIEPDVAAHVTNLETTTFDNDGTVAVPSGIVSVQNTDGSDAATSNDAGTWNTGDEGTVRFDAGRTNLGRSDALKGTGSFAVSGARLHTEHGVALPAEQSLLLNSGSLTGSGTLGGGSFVWKTALSLGTPAAFTIGEGASLDLITEGGWYDLAGETSLANEGTLKFHRATKLYGDGALTNETTGVVLKNTSEHTSYIETSFDNEGTVDATSGTLVLPAGVTSGGVDTYDAQTFTGGSYTVGAAAKIRFSEVMDVLTNKGSFEFRSSGQIVDGSAAGGQNIFRNLATNDGVLRLEDSASFVVPTLTNTGTVWVGSNSAFTATNSYTQTGENSLTRIRDENDDEAVAFLETAEAVFQDGRLDGNGIILGNVTNNGAEVAPGNSPGTLSVTGNFTQNSGALVIEVEGNTPGTFDQLAVTGSAVLKGTLKLVTSGYTPAWDDTFTMVSSEAAPPTLGFTEIQGDNLTSGMEYQAKIVNGVLQLLVQDVTPPSNVAAGENPSTSHDYEIWSTDRTVELPLSGATDTHSGLAGYSVVWSTSATTTGSTTKTVNHNIDGTTAVSSSLASGKQWAHVRTVDNEGNWSPGTVHYGPYFIDATAPSGAEFKSPTAAMTVSLAGTASAPKVVGEWSKITDAHSGVLRTTLTVRSSKDGKTWNQVFKANYGTTGGVKSLAAVPGATYCFAVARLDMALNTATSERCTTVPFDSPSLTPGKTSHWSKQTSGSYYFGSAVKSTTNGATLTRKNVTAKRLFVVATKCRDCGSVQVYFNGKAVGSKINLHITSKTPLHKQVISAGSLSSISTGTLSVKVVSTGGKPVTVDGLGAGLK